MPKTLAEELRERFAAALESARAGTFRCPGCRKLRPKLTDEDTVFFLFCATCRGETAAAQEWA